MNITKILEDIIPSRQSVQLNRPLTGKKLDKRSMIGQGYFSIVNPDRDPHMIKKYNYRLESKDGFNAYIEYIIDNNLTSNPYFPRIYNIKKVAGNNGKITHKYTIEKLISGSELSEDELLSVMDRIFTKDTIENIVHQEKVDAYGRKRFAGPDFNRAICAKLSGCLAGQQINDVITDESLVRAIMAIRTIKNIEASTIDLFGDNLLYRRTKYGVQPVFSDPLA